MLKVDLSNKVAIVTGARRGIGKCIALEFAKAGADVVVADRVVDDGELAKVVKEIEALGRRSISVAVDVRIPEQVDNLVKQTVGGFGKIDILVNNAGANFVCAVEEMSPNGWNAIIDVNLKGPFLCCKAAGGVMMQQKGGKIINIASIAGLDAAPKTAHYGAAKAGLINFTQSLAVEWADYHINVNAIAPAGIETEGGREAMELTPEMREEEAKNMLWGRMGKPEDVAYTALFLASEASDFITGETVVVSGGANLSRGPL